MGTVTLKKFVFPKQPKANQKILLAWRLLSAPDIESSYIPLPTATVDVIGNIVNPLNYKITNVPENNCIVLRGIPECGGIGFKKLVTYYTGTGEGGGGWTPVYEYSNYNGKVIKELVDMIGGVGEKPSDNIGKFLMSGGGWTEDPALAGDFSNEIPDQNGGWSPIWAPEQYDGKTLKKLIGYVGGTGTPPTEHIGEYLTQDLDWTDDKDEAGDFPEVSNQQLIYGDDFE